MVISFETAEIRDFLERKESQLEKLSPTDCQSLQSRISDISAALTLEDVKLFFKKRGREMYFEVSDKITLVAVSNHPNKSLDQSNEIELDKVFRVKIIEIIL